MKKIVLIFLLVFVVCSCGPVRYIPVEKNETVNIRDSVVLRDSTVITYLQKERIKEVVPELDTLVMESTYARSKSYLDTTTNTLQGTLEQLDSVPVKTKIVFKDRIITQEKIVKKDIPVEVVREKKVTPKWIWWSLGCNLLILLFLILKMKLKFLNLFS